MERRSSSSSTREIEEESVVCEELEEEEEKVYVALKEELKEGKATLLWLLQNTSREKKKIVITHVHVPAQMIPMMGSKFPANKVKPQIVKDYRDREREKMRRSLDDYMTVCSQLKARAEILVFEAEDVAKGLLEVVALHGITELVMGAAADKKYSRKMKVPKSKTAITMKRQADPCCRIWFVCKGNLICTREDVPDSSSTASPSTSVRSSTSSRNEQMRSVSLPQEQVVTLRNTHTIPDLYRSRSDNLLGGGNVATSSPPVTTFASRSRFSSEVGPTTDLTVDVWDAMSSRTSPSLNHSASSASDDISNSDSLSLYKDGENAERAVIPPLVQVSDDGLQFSSPHNELEDVDTEVYDKLQEAMMEADNLRHQAYKESLRRQTAEKKAIDALKRAKASESLYAKEAKQRKDVEEALERQKIDIEILKNQRDETMEQGRMANMQKEALEVQIDDSNRIIKDFEEKLMETKRLFDTLQVEYEELQLQKQTSVREAEEQRQKNEAATTSANGMTYFSDFSYSEIEQATCSFSRSLKIGEGGYGSVYKGFLRSTVVAIKMLNPEGMQGQSEFHQEVNVLSRVRHPNLVTLIGTCSEAWALIYEFLPGGSLEDRLDCKNIMNSPLTWQTRTRIATEICSSLIFLHSNKPHSIVHGDLKPDNILLDANLVSKLGDFGICRLLLLSTTTATLYRHTNPKGTFAYMDPEFQATGELTPQSDVYSFGVILLRLLTGKPPLGLVKEVRDALAKGALQGMIDASAGNWPFVQAKQLAHLGLRCCEMNRKSRPDLVGEVWRVLEPMLRANSSSVWSLSFGSVSEDSSPVPNYFMCPIFQEIMSDPQIAADGFTYEAEAIRGWIDSGHDTSPMTNVKLPHLALIPNRALRSAIQEWLQQHRR